MSDIDVAKNIKDFVTSERKLESSTLTKEPHLCNQINVRLSNLDVALIDDQISKIEKQYPGLKVSRGEMARILILRGAIING